MNQKTLKRCAAAACVCMSVIAPSSPADVTVRREMVFATGLDTPLGIFTPPGEPDYLMIVQKAGGVRVVNIQTGTLLPTPFLTVPSVVSQAEQGMYSIAFHPQYTTNGMFWVYYIRGGTENVIARGHRSAADPHVADPTLEDVFVLPGANQFHNGGFMSFGPDGNLYVAIGDNTNLNNGQDINVLRSKILRLDADGPDNIPGNADDDAFPGDPAKLYAVPPTNPYVGINGLDEIWCTGVRNPFRGSFDRDTGDLWIGDVGAESREEVTRIPAGTGGWNLGWPCREGFGILIGCAPWQPYLPPVFDFGLNGTVPAGSQVYAGFRFVIGGYVYRGPAMPCLQGTYIFADGASGIYSIRRSPTGAVTNFTDRRDETIVYRPTAFGESNAGELFMVQLQDPGLHRIVFSSLNGPDCDGDGLPDDCEIRFGYAQDSNGNGLPDPCEGFCGDIDYDNDGVSPSSDDITAFLAVFGGAACPSVHCDSIDFNGDGVSPSTEDIESFLRVFSGGNC